MFVLHLIPIAAASGITAGFGIAVGGGLGAVGAGVGIGIIFGKVIEAVTRQPEMRDEITSIQWLGIRTHRSGVLLRARRRPAVLRAQVDGARSLTSRSPLRAARS